MNAPPEKPIPATYQDWVRAIQERDTKAQQPRKRKSRTGY